MNARQTVEAYFAALTTGDADRLIDLISPADHFIKIGTEPGEHIEGGGRAAQYYRHHVASTQDFTIDTEHLDVQERGAVAWFLYPAAVAAQMARPVRGIDLAFDGRIGAGSGRVEVRADPRFHRGGLARGTCAADGKTLHYLLGSFCASYIGLGYLAQPDKSYAQRHPRECPSARHASRWRPTPHRNLQRLAPMATAWRRCRSRTRYAQTLLCPPQYQRRRQRL